MTDRPLISVITPAFNSEKFIEATVRSALNQTYANLEVLVTDDGSTDRTAEIVQRIAAADPRVKYFRQANAGQSAARNTAIAAARGEYVAFLDADDLFLPVKLERQIAYLEKHPDCGVCYCKIYHFWNDEPGKLFYMRLDHPSGLLFRELLARNFINPLSVVLRRSLLRQFGAFEHSFRREDEQYLWLKLSYHQVRFDYLDEPLGLYRIHKQSLSNEAVYFKETEEKFLELLRQIETWMPPADRSQHGFDQLIRRTKRRIWIGRLMAGRNPFARMLLTLYNRRRNKKLEPVTL